MISALLDRLFGKRDRKGWPRGVKPMFSFLDEWKRTNPELWEQTKGMPPSAAFSIWRDKHPELFAKN